MPSSDAFRKYQEKKSAPKAPPPRPKHSALSVASGTARAAKDFHWVDANIPCQAACPAKTDIPGYLDAIAQGDFAGAYRINLRDNVFPAVLGRVCTRPCEPACRHGWEGLGEPVAICFSKRSASDFQQRGEPVVLEKLFEPSGKSVAVVGAGAAGLATARELALWGHAVTVYEKEPLPGGMMVQGIPEFRLPRAIVALEVEQIRCLGVDIRCGIEVGRTISLDEIRSQHDAVVLAAGTALPAWPELPGSDAAGVEHGFAFLREVNAGRRTEIGARVVVMADRDLSQARIAFQTRVNPVAILAENGRVTGVRFVRTEAGAPGPDGRRAFRVIPGSDIEVPADAVLLATGQRADRSWMPEAWVAAIDRSAGGMVQVESGVFVVGDFAAGARSLIDAIADGRNGARAVDAHLVGRNRFEDVVRIESAEETGRTREMDAWPRNPMPVLPVERRDRTAEVETGFDAEAAKKEAKRCYLCHFKYEINNELCIYCDRCLKVKPVENCIVKVSSLIIDARGRITGFNRSTGAKDYNLLYIDQSQCIRCGACKDVCPVECIDLQKVSRQTCAIQS